MKKISIAIDGPSGVGKSTIAKNIAKKLGLIFINTGLMYRAIGYITLKNNINFEDEKKIIEIIKQNKIELLPNEIIKINDKDITSQLWNDEISLAASYVAKLEMVRKYCVEKQQQMAKTKLGVVMEGRDIGSVVLKDADLKIFLTATSEVRAQRRINQLSQKFENINKDQIFKNILERDKRDSEREITPLKKVDDAIEIDTSNITIDEVINIILNLAHERMK